MQKSRLHFCICFVGGLIGLFAALFGGYTDAVSNANFIILIRIGEFNPIAYFFLVMLLTCLLFFALFVASYRFILFLGIGYGSLILSSYLLWRLAFISTAIDGIFGIIFLFLFIMPIFVLNWFTFSFSLNSIYDVCGFSYNRRLPTTISWQCSLIFRTIKRFWICSLIFNFVWWLVLYIIFSLIF